MSKFVKFLCWLLFVGILCLIGYKAHTDGNVSVAVSCGVAIIVLTLLMLYLPSAKRREHIRQVETVSHFDHYGLVEDQLRRVSKRGSQMTSAGRMEQLRSIDAEVDNLALLLDTLEANPSADADEAQFVATINEKIAALRKRAEAVETAHGEFTSTFDSASESFQELKEKVEELETTNNEGFQNGDGDGISLTDAVTLLRTDYKEIDDDLTVLEKSVSAEVIETVKGFEARYAEVNTRITALGVRRDEVVEMIERVENLGEEIDERVTELEEGDESVPDQVARLKEIRKELNEKLADIEKRLRKLPLAA